jgi:hypothetical protein
VTNDAWVVLLTVWGVLCFVVGLFLGARWTWKRCAELMDQHAKDLTERLAEEQRAVIDAHYRAQAKLRNDLMNDTSRRFGS